MSQKTHPTSLRLQKTHKHFSSFWYTDLFFSQMGSFDLQAKLYIESVSEQMESVQMLPYVQRHYKRMQLFLFCHKAAPLISQKEQRMSRTLAYENQTRYGKGKNRAGFRDIHQNFSTKQLRAYAASTRVQKHLYAHTTHSQSQTFSFLCNLPSFSSQTFGQRLDMSDQTDVSSWKESNIEQSPASKNTLCYAGEKIVNSWKKVHYNKRLLVKLRLTQPADVSIRPAIYALPSLYENLTRLYFKKSTHAGVVFPVTASLNAVTAPLFSRLWDYVSTYPVCVTHDIQSAELLAKSISSLLKRGFSLKRIQNQVVRECQKDPNVKGVRFSCSGRVGSAFQKAQKSQTQSIQWGETCLHVFSSRLSFAKRSVVTPFGKLGIKLWLSFK